MNDSKRRSLIRWIGWWLLLSLAWVQASTVLILDAGKDRTVLQKSEETLQQALGSDASLASLAKKKALKVGVRKVGQEYYLMSVPLPSDAETAALYWRLHSYFPHAVTLEVAGLRKITMKTPAFEGPVTVSKGDVTLWIAIFTLAVIGILALFVSSQQIRKIRERHEKILRRHEAIEKRMSELFNRLGEDIYQMGQKAVDYTSQLIKKQGGEGLDNHLQEVVSIESRIVDSATNLLSFLRLKAKKVAVKEEKFSIDNMLDDVVETLDSELRENKTELIFEVDKNVPRDVIGDFTHIGEIVSKVLEHAILFTAGTQVRFQVASNTPYVGKAELVMRVYYPPRKDEEAPETYFVPVFDEEHNRYRRLGLYVAYELTDLLEGSISVSRHSSRSEMLVEITLPVRLVDEKERRRYVFPEGFSRKDILLVNRSYEASVALKQMFTYFRHRVTIMDEEAFERTRPPLERFDIVAVDETLIDELFIAYARKLRKKQELKVVALHNIFQPMRQDLDKDVVDLTANKPMNLQRVFNLLLELYGQKPELEERRPVESSETEKELAPQSFEREYPETKGVGLDSFSRFAGAKLLVVEDNPLNMKMLLKVLERSGINILQAFNGEEAVETVKRVGPDGIDLVLMDINMPVMDGYRATREIRALRGGDALPVVALSALNLDNERQRMRESGMDGYLPKPLQLGRLYTVFERYLPQKEEAGTAASDARNVPRPEGLDWAVAMAHVNDNEMILREILESFVAAYRDSPQRLASLFAERDYEGMQKTLLDLIGLSGTIGATELHRIVKELYKSLILYRIDRVDELLRAYRGEMERLVDAIDRYIQGR